MGKRATVRVWDWRGGELFKGAVLPVTPGQRAGLYQPVNLSALVWTGFLLSRELSAGWKPRCVIEQCMTAWKPRGFTSFITSPCTHAHTHTGDWLIKLRGVSASAVCAEKLIFGCDHFCVCETSSPGQPEQRSHRPPVEVSRTCTLSHASCKSWVISEQWHWVVLYYRWVFAAVKYLCSVGTLKAFTAQFILPNGFIKSSLNASTSPLGE